MAQPGPHQEALPARANSPIKRTHMETRHPQSRAALHPLHATAQNIPILSPQTLLCHHSAGKTHTVEAQTPLHRGTSPLGMDQVWMGALETGTERPHVPGHLHSNEEASSLVESNFHILPTKFCSQRPRKKKKKEVKALINAGRAGSSHQLPAQRSSGII